MYNVLSEWESVSGGYIDLNFTLLVLLMRWVPFLLFSRLVTFVWGDESRQSFCSNCDHDGDRQHMLASLLGENWILSGFGTWSVLITSLLRLLSSWNMLLSWWSFSYCVTIYKRLASVCPAVGWCCRCRCTNPTAIAIGLTLFSLPSQCFRICCGVRRHGSFLCVVDGRTASDRTKYASSLCHWCSPQFDFVTEFKYNQCHFQSLTCFTHSSRYWSAQKDRNTRSLFDEHRQSS